MKKDKVADHDHNLQLIPSNPSESVWECTVKDCYYIEIEPEDAGTGGG